MDVDATPLASGTGSQTPIPARGGVPQSRLTVPVGRATTTAMHSTNPAANEDLTSFFECPVCFDYVLPPIIQVSDMPPPSGVYFILN